MKADAITFLNNKNSFSKGSGKLVGQMDPHTIEVDVEGKKEAFQLTDEAKKQLTTLKEGITLTFFFIENDIGQKVIQRFVLEVQK